ncbi:MAG: ABC transporter substrate-binding protein [Acidimicrobiales bacterium]
MFRTTTIRTVLAVALLAAACSSDATSTAAGGDRCATNTAAGTIKYASGFTFAADAGIVDVLMAEEKGYFADECLTVELIPSDTGTNAGLLASGEIQIANVGNITDVLSANLNADAGMVVIAHYGRVPIEALAVPADGAQTIAELQGGTVGVKFNIPTSIQNMMAAEGAPRGSFDEVQVGFDPVNEGFNIGLDALPVYSNNEPFVMDAAGIAYRLFSPSDFDIPGSFGYLVTTQSFLDANPGVVEDFLRASFRGMQDALASPDEAVALAVSKLATTDFAFYTEVTEGPRWTTESALIRDAQPEGVGLGTIDSALIGSEVQLMVENGILESMPDWEAMLDPSIADGLYDGTDLVWPGPAGK